MGEGCTRWAERLHQMDVKVALDERKSASDVARLSTDIPTAAPPVESFLRHHAPKTPTFAEKSPTFFGKSPTKF